MTRIEIALPDQLAEEAQKAGLFSSDRLELSIREQLRVRRGTEFFSAMDRMAAMPEPAAMTPEELSLELNAMRQERRSR